MSGLSLEALNDIGQRKTQMLIVVNDNEMSISPTVGAFSKYLSQIKLSSAWRQSKGAYDRAVERIPLVGPHLLELSRRLRASVVRFAQPGQLFEDLGITYIGVVPGHDIRALLETLGAALALPGPTIVHVRTQKGRGYRPAIEDQVGFHGAALPPMRLAPGADTYDGSRTVPSSTTAPSGCRPSRWRTMPRHRRRSPPRRRRTPTTPLSSRPSSSRPAGRIGASWVSRPGCRRGRGCRSSPRSSPTGCSTSASRSSTRSRSRRVSRWVACARSSPLLDLRPARVRPDRPRRLPERPARDPGRRPGRASSARTGPRHQGMFTVPAQRQLPNLIIASPKDEQELRSLLRTALGAGSPVRAPLPTRSRVRTARRSSR